MNEELTIDIVYQTLKDFFKEKLLVVFGTGVSCALDTEFGMPALSKELLNKVPGKLSSEQDKIEWSNVATEIQDDSKGLETAMNSVQSDALILAITSITGRFIARLDKKYSYEIFQRKKEWPAAPLFQKLVNGLPETDRVLHVLTPNYDMLLEHSCDSANINYINGFVGGIQRTLDWERCRRQLQYVEANPSGNRYRSSLKYKKHIRLYKVHGSLNLFKVNGKIVENNAWMWNPPDFVERVIVTPGKTKHEKMIHFRDELLGPADRAIKKENVFLFIGYGFNDSHLETYIKLKLLNQRCRGLIITRDSNERIDKLMEQAENLWLVCKQNGIEGSTTVIRNKRYSGALKLANKKLWDITEFTREILGD